MNNKPLYDIKNGDDNQEIKKSFFNWSGGKDSALALYYSLNDPSIEVKYLLTTVNKDRDRISMHGVRRELLKVQAENIGIELKEVSLPENTSMETYENAINASLTELKTEGIEYSIFGDIFLEDLREYREKKLAEAGIKGLFPLWRKPTRELIKEFIDSGFKTIVVCVNDKYLDKSFAGRIIDNDFLNDLPDNVDPCGENGEFHTFVFDGPIFKNKINLEPGELVFKEYKPDSQSDSDNDGGKHDTRFWYKDILLKQ
jgi:uncharacterized protein (TIGR00290 family)